MWVFVLDAMKPGKLDISKLDDFGIEVYSYSTLPVSIPNGFWILNNENIIPCHDSKGAHYITGLIILTSFGIKKYNIALNFILQQYESIENFAKEAGCNSDRVRRGRVLSYEDVYMAMYSPPVNAVRLNRTIRERTSLDIRSPFINNKKNINLAKDIAMFYNLDYNYATYIT